MLFAAIILGLFTVSIVGFSMHALLLEETIHNDGREILPGNRHHLVGNKKSNSNTLPSLRPGCADESPHCEEWAADGNCRKNPAHMFTECLASCGGCDASYKHAIPQSIELRYRQKMPTIGFGTAGLGAKTKEIVEMALKEGYRRIDSAQAREWYRENLVGAALRAVSSTISRDQIFITTKVHPRDLGSHATKAAIEKSLKDLNTNYLDLVLLHYAECWGDLCQGKSPEGTWEESWAELEALVAQGVIQSIGVSNFSIDQLASLLSIATVKPSLVQSNYEPLRPARGLQAFCERNGIHFESYSTLGGQYGGDPSLQRKNPVLEHPEIVALAKRKEKSPAQIVLRWALQLGQTVVPRTTRVGHMRENAAIFDFDLTDDDMNLLESLAGDGRGTDTPTDINTKKTKNADTDAGSGVAVNGRNE
jgi:diketogulonate reductase-like aldo/keto reductase